MINYALSLLFFIVAIVALRVSFKYQMEYYDPQYRVTAFLLQILGSVFIGNSVLMQCLDGNLKSSTMLISWAIVIAMTYIIFSYLVHLRAENK